MLVLRIGVLAVLLGNVSCRDLLVGAFNIQVYGRTKASNTRVMDILVKIIRRYDLILIQEIRDSSTNSIAINTLLEQVNSGQSEKFTMLLSKRLGRSMSKEQYAYFYKKDAGLQLVKEYVYDDVKIQNGKQVDLFERQPYIVSFKSKKTELASFGLIGIHVDPDVAVEEINDLHRYVFDDTRVRLKQPNLMLLGDLNADCSYVSKSKWKMIPMKHDPAFDWLIGDDEDTTVKGSHCAYDRFITTGPDWTDGIVTGSVKVFRFDKEPSIGYMDKELAEDVSDHYPIEFLLAEKQFVLIVITNRVYVKLAGVYESKGSLPHNQFYELRANKNIDYLYAYNNEGQLVGWLNKEYEAEVKLIRALENILTSTNNAVKAYIEPIKNRYGGKQNSELYIAVPANDEQRVNRIWNSLNDICQQTYFKCIKS